MAVTNSEDRGVLLVEWLAATAVFCIVGAVLYMVFAYKPY